MLPYDDGWVECKVPKALSFNCVRASASTVVPIAAYAPYIADGNKATEPLIFSVVFIADI